MKVYVRAKLREICLSVFKPKLLEAYLKKVKSLQKSFINMSKF